MNLGGKTLADWLLAQPVGELPVRSFAYQDNYAALASNLLPLHKEVTATANRVDGGYLTDHGPDHIRKLISRISELLSAGEGLISAYEAYVLLCAAQFHDVGNIFGRDKHEEMSWQIMERNRTTLPPDNIEYRLIYDIAQAHGGDRKDKLSDLPRTYDIAQTTVRPQLLAAILKFADELAEDSERAARYTAQLGQLGGSEIFHEYALALQNISIDGLSREVRMQFVMPVSKATRTFTKGSVGATTNVYLLDEIFKRTMKCHCERMYCSRFMRSVIDLTAVSVNIAVTNEAGYKVEETIAYKLAETGYPDSSGQDIYEICDDLKRWKNVGRLNGLALKSELEQAHV
ncbi:hypothetical protein ABIB90_004861 [Bradyrhizobium sp. JR4.1]